MARTDPRKPGPAEESSLILPAALGIGTVILCSAILPALAGPYILAEFKQTRYIALIYTIHGLLYLVLGYSGGLHGKTSSLGITTAIAAFSGAAGALFYTKLGILPATGVHFSALIGGGAVLGLIGALVGAAFVSKNLTPATVYMGLLIAIFVGTFLRTGTVSGNATRPVNQITFGMMTGQQDEPVPGVPVILTRMDGEAQLYRTSTDSLGGYVFNGPPPGEYMLYVQDVQPDRGSGVWVNTKVKAGGMMSGQGLGTGDISLPTYRHDQGSPFLDKPPQGNDPASRATRTGGGTQGQMNRMIDEARGKRGY